MTEKLGVAAARMNQIEPTIVQLSRETVPEGIYFIGAETGKIYKLVKWHEGPGDCFDLFAWNTQTPSLEYVRLHPEPDGQSCVFVQRMSPSQPQQVIVIGTEPLGVATVSFAVPDPVMEEEGLVEIVEEPVPECEEVEPDSVEDEEESNSWEAEEQDPEVMEEREQEAQEHEVQLSEEEERELLCRRAIDERAEQYRPKNARIDEDSVSFKATISEIKALRWNPKTECKIDWVRKAVDVMREHKQALSVVKHLAPMAVEAGVWDDTERAGRLLRGTLKGLVKAQPSYRFWDGMLVPPDRDMDTSPPVEYDVPIRQRVDVGEDEEISEPVMKARLGLLDSSDVWVTVSVQIPASNLLTPERAAELNALLNAWGDSLHD